MTLGGRRRPGPARSSTAGRHPWLSEPSIRVRTFAGPRPPHALCWAAMQPKVLVTGGGRGIGRAIALRFAREGAKVAIAARNSSDLDKVVGEIDAAGGDGLAAQMDLKDVGSVEAAVWRAREAFFGQARNVCDREVQLEIMQELALPADEISRLMENGEAYAALHEDHEAQTEYRVPGSPTLIMNEGRQRLYGNLGYRILRANVEELLRDPRSGEASWC